MARKTLSITICFVFLWAGITVPSAARAENPQDILIIANSTVAINKVDINELRSIFLKTRSSWPGGKKVVPINSADGTSLRKTFVKKVLGMSIAQEQEYWQKKKIMEGTTPPTSFKNTLKAVFNLKGSVSYVFRSDYKKVGKILLVIPAG